jgi:hypothetical protein
VDLSYDCITFGIGSKGAPTECFEELFMKSMLYTLTALLMLSGCSQSKNRLADDNNVEYQKRNASKIPKPAAPKSEVVDLPTASQGEDPSGEKIQKPKTAEPTPTPDIPARNEPVEGASPTAPVVKNEKPKAAAPAATASAPKPATPAATAPATAAPAATAPAATAAQAPATNQTPHLLSYDELVAILTAISQNFAAKEEINVILEGFINVEENPDIDVKKLLPVAKSTADGISAAILYDSKPLTLVEKANVTLDGKLLQIDASNGYKFHAACALEKCDLLFTGFYKFTGDKVSTNLPCFFKKVGDQYVIAVRRPKAYYEEEAKKRANQAPAATAQK